MLDFNLSASAAFTAATKKLRPLQAFTAPVREIMAEITQAIVLQDGVTFEEDNPHCHGRWYRYKGHRLYGRAVQWGESAPLSIASANLREKLYSDIAQDLNLPHTALCFSVDEKNHGERPITLSVEPFPNSEDLWKDELQSTRSHFDSAENMFGEFLKQNPYLIPQFMVLAPFDLWIYNWDRHAANIVAGARSPTSKFQAICGIDLDRCDPDENNIKQKYAIRALINPESVSPLRAALTAITKYPEERILQLAKSLSPYAETQRDWNPEQETDLLLTSRKTVPERLSQCMPKHFAEMLHV